MGHSDSTYSETYVIWCFKAGKKRKHHSRLKLLGFSIMKLSKFPMNGYFPYLPWHLKLNWVWFKHLIQHLLISIRAASSSDYSIYYSVALSKLTAVSVRKVCYQRDKPEQCLFSVIVELESEMRGKKEEFKKT